MLSLVERELPKPDQLCRDCGRPATIGFLCGSCTKAALYVPYVAPPPAPKPPPKPARELPPTLRRKLERQREREAIAQNVAKAILGPEQPIGGKSKRAVAKTPPPKVEEKPFIDRDGDGVDVTTHPAWNTAPISSPPKPLPPATAATRELWATTRETRDHGHEQAAIARRKARYGAPPSTGPAHDPRMLALAYAPDPRIWT